MAWYRANGRKLPWRQTPANPYHVWLSEVIMQQTRIQQGTAYWQRFVSQWRTVEELAAASEQEVMRMWQGLGYYSRARNLHKAARMIADRGAFPSTYDEILQLPGVGPYTASAIASICFEEARAVVDGNVFRVLSRVFDIDTPIDTSPGIKLFHTLAEELLLKENPGEWNQALMDFGALVCTPQGSHCTECPLSEECLARAAGNVDKRPMKRGKTKVRDRHLVYVLAVCRDAIALHQRTANDIWKNLWEPFLMEISTDKPSSPSLFPPWAQQAEPLRMGVRHVLTHQRLMCDFWILHAEQQPPLPDDFRWVPLDEVDRYGLPRVVLRMMENHITRKREPDH